MPATRVGRKRPRGGGKADSKGKLVIKKDLCKAKTKSGKSICILFNRAGKKCTKKKCKFEHVCGVCGKPGVPMFECDHQR